MPTTIHIPQELLKALDQKSRNVHMSRNKYICALIQKDLCSAWPESFLKKKFAPKKDLTEGVEELMKNIKSHRHNKKSTSL